MRYAAKTAYVFLVPDEIGYAEEFEKYHDMSMWEKHGGTTIISYTNRADMKVDAENCIRMWKSWDEAKRGKKDERKK